MNMGQEELSSKSEPTSQQPTEIQRKLLALDKEEYQKCVDSPFYFYNKCVRKEGQKELTEDEYNAYIKQVEYIRNTPMTPSECHKKPPYSLNLKE